MKQGFLATVGDASSTKSILQVWSIRGQRAHLCTPVSMTKPPASTSIMKQSPKIYHSSIQVCPQVSLTAVDVLRMSMAVNENMDDYSSGEGVPKGGKEAAKNGRQIGDIEMRDFGAAAEHSDSSGTCTILARICSIQCLKACVAFVHNTIHNVRSPAQKQPEMTQVGGRKVCQRESIILMYVLLFGATHRVAKICLPLVRARVVL